MGQYPEPIRQSLCPPNSSGDTSLGYKLPQSRLSFRVQRYDTVCLCAHTIAAAVPIHPDDPLLKILKGHICAVAPFKPFPCCISTPECILCAESSSPRPPSCISAEAELMYSGPGSRLDGMLPAHVRQDVGLPGLWKLAYVAF